MSPSSRVTSILALGLFLGAAGGLGWDLFRSERAPGDLRDAGPGVARDHAEDEALTLAGASASVDREAFAKLLRAKFNRRGLRANETVLIFKNALARDRFLARSGSSGVTVLGRIDGQNVIRVRVADYDAFVSELGSNVGDYQAVTVNPVLTSTPPPAEERGARIGAPVGNGLLAALGLVGEPAGSNQWGAGVTIAVLDGGAFSDVTLGSRLRYLDIGNGFTSGGEDGAHGTAVAALAAGAAADARGVAPGASVLSIRVTGADGVSDAFSLAQGIYTAVDAGAQVINISLGGYATNAVLGEAVDYALASGVAVVAAAGNDQAAQLAWPAAYAGVVSVGAVDAAGQQAIFSNSGDGLQITAPGYAVQTAGPNGTRVIFSGTSASAPVVAGAIAGIMSQSPGLKAIEAADVLISHANDGGAVGVDANYGNGSVNLSWALGRNDANRVDPVIASQNYNASTGTVSVVVQNQGAKPIAGLVLGVQAGSTNSSYTLPELAAGASSAIAIPLTRAEFANSERVIVRSLLATPAGLSDQNTANNQRSGVISAQ